MPRYTGQQVGTRSPGLTMTTLLCAALVLSSTVINAANPGKSPFTILIQHTVCLNLKLCAIKPQYSVIRYVNCDVNIAQLELELKYFKANDHYYFQRHTVAIFMCTHTKQFQYLGHIISLGSVGQVTNSYPAVYTSVSKSNHCHPIGF